ncbi:hypothetical protein BU25DRAFT_268523 [Macroventuria anomochaeta]|uniref:Uncharacterized protein n=1 Tax=Macroventuria anomochaeta TaxID=301207 RepID=A0ACB6S663_9PLEO|nr:uncharacterized protein BU25DRAFT_268523 [Macroventuria anomochaeta]KAF2629539.1 hypothetical protein BU25DRAFT_268523 [Macroventuria anomochaeta]
MPQTLHRFGFNSDAPTLKITSPTLVDSSTQINIVWTSWCDLIYTTTNADNTRSITYTGTSLNTTQQQELTSLTSNINQALANPTCQLYFFGNTMYDGVRGYICDGKITVFGTPAEEAALRSQYHDIEFWTFPPPLAEIRMCSDNSLFLTSKPEPYETGSISNVTNLHAVKAHCTCTTPIDQRASFAPTQLVTNATTTTALSPSGLVYTLTTDPRYPSCLGRPYTGTSSFEPVPYLSETRITKIASGGYMTAAISEDGELFLWGQANPGTAEELGVLHRLDYDSDAAMKRETVIWGDTVQDENVKCLNIHIDGRDAIAYDVAIGFGHMLVAAKGEDEEHVVFSAGCGAEGQLGIGRADDFLQESEEVVAVRGKRVIQLAAAGWSSFVVTEE